jgi:LCP family protein required for cell wall assembly
MHRVEQSRIDRVRRKRQKKWFIRILAFVFLTVLGIGLYFGSQIWGVFAGSKNELKQSKLREQEVKIKEDPFTVLLIGTDQRKPTSRDWRSDVLMVVAVNPKTNSAKVVSIPRDTYVKIACKPDVKTKINASVYFGYETGVGPIQCVRETVENLLHIPIDYYARINFQGFTDIVDALGGVDVVVEKEFSQAMIGGGYAHFKPGPRHLNGREALAYVRKRKGFASGDLARNERQREVVSLLIDKIVSLDGITKFSEITDALGRNFEYSFDITELPALMSVYKKIPKKNIETIEFQVLFKKLPKSGDVVILPKNELNRVREILQKQLEYKPKEPIQDSADDQTGQDTADPTESSNDSGGY